MSTHRLRRAVAAALCAVPLAVAACSGSPSTSATATLAPGTTTTTTVPPAQEAILRSLLLTSADFPAGWTQDTQADAAGVQGTPACVADLVVVHGSAERVNAVFVGPGQSPPAVIQTVSAFAPGAAARSVRALRATFDGCDGRTIDAVSEGFPIAIGQKVRVIEVRGNRVVVRTIEDDTPGGNEADPLARPIDSVIPDPFGESET